MEISTITLHSAALWLQAPQPNPNAFTPEQRFEIARAAMARPSHEAIGILVPIALFAMVVLIVWIVIRRKQVMMQGQIELRKQLIDKFGSGQELATFLESKAGQQFLQDMRSQRVGPRGNWTAGLVLSMVGLALLILSLTHRTHDFDGGAVLLAIGGALLISSAIHHRLAKQSDTTIGPGSGNQPVLPA